MFSVYLFLLWYFAARCDPVKEARSPGSQLTCTVSCRMKIRATRAGHILVPVLRRDGTGSVLLFARRH